MAARQELRTALRVVVDLECQDQPELTVPLEDAHVLALLVLSEQRGVTEEELVRRLIVEELDRAGVSAER